MGAISEYDKFDVFWINTFKHHGEINIFHAVRNTAEWHHVFVTRGRAYSHW